MGRLHNCQRGASGHQAVLLLQCSQSLLEPTLPAARRRELTLQLSSAHLHAMPGALLHSRARDALPLGTRLLHRRLQRTLSLDAPRCLRLRGRLGCRRLPLELGIAHCRLLLLLARCHRRRHRLAPLALRLRAHRLARVRSRRRQPPLRRLHSLAAGTLVLCSQLI